MAKTRFSHPGGILKREFLDELGLSVSAAATAMKMSRARLNEIVRGDRSVTADSALRLARFFGTTPEFWMNLQSHYDLSLAASAQRALLRGIDPLDRASHATA
jgi:addiction module HigA family antidote